MGNNQSGSSLVDISDKLEIDENKDVNTIKIDATKDVKIEKEDGQEENKVQCKTKNENLDSLKRVKFFEQIDYMLDKVKKFDNRTNGNINSWLFKYETYCDYFGWSNNERVNGLIYLFDSSVMKITNAELNSSYLQSLNYEEVKEDLIDFTNRLLSLPFFDDYQTTLESNIMEIMSECKRLGFTNFERSFWLNCFLPSHKLLELYNDPTEYFKYYFLPYLF